MRRAVLFDLDGTLLDPAGSIRGTLERVLREEGLPGLDEGPRSLVGMPLRDILRLRCGDPGRVEELVRRYREVFAQRTWRSVRFYPGVLEVVDRLADRGVPLGVVTTKGEEEAHLLLERLGVRDRFGAVVGDDDVRPVKPDPAPVQAACGRLGLLPRWAAMVGDTWYDVAAGRAAGAYTVGVLWGHGSRRGHDEAGADAVAGDAAGLERVLQEWLASGGAHRDARIRR